MPIYNGTQLVSPGVDKVYNGSSLVYSAAPAAKITKVADIPSTYFYNSAVCVYDNKMYIFGGTSRVNNTTSVKRVFVFDPSDNSVTQLNDLPTGVGIAATAQWTQTGVGNVIGLFGGNPDGGSTGSGAVPGSKNIVLYYPDTDTSELLNTQLAQTAIPGYAEYRGTEAKVYVFSGFNYYGGPTSSDQYVVGNDNKFTPSNNTCTTISSNYVRRKGVDEYNCTTQYNGTTYLYTYYGTYNGGNCTIETIDYSQNSSTGSYGSLYYSIPSATLSTRRSSATVLGDNMYIIGGVTASNYQTTSRKIYKFNIPNKTLEDTGDELPNEASAATSTRSVTINGKIYILDYNRIYKYTP